jgi:hypothetical protein
MVLDNTETLLLELLEVIEMSLGIEFTPQEHRILLEYLAQNQNANPQAILNQILGVVEKKRAKKISEDELKKIQIKAMQTKMMIEQERKNITFRKKGNRFSEQDEKKIIKEAEKKLIDDKFLKKPLDEKKFQEAKEYFRNYSGYEESAVFKANIALLGVISVNFTGGVQPVVLYNWGNLLNITDYNNSHGYSAGGAAIDQAARADSTFGDSMGTEAKTIVNLIQLGSINDSVLNKVAPQINEAKNLEPSESSTSTSKSSAPKLTPFADMPKHDED